MAGERDVLVSVMAYPISICDFGVTDDEGKDQSRERQRSQRRGDTDATANKLERIVLCHTSNEEYGRTLSI